MEPAHWAKTLPKPSRPSPKIPIQRGGICRLAKAFGHSTALAIQRLKLRPD